jgi:hypothetical protein
VEKDWLVAEVSDFLKHLSNQKSWQNTRNLYLLIWKLHRAICAPATNRAIIARYQMLDYLIIVETFRRNVSTTVAMLRILGRLIGWVYWTHLKMANWRE